MSGGNHIRAVGPKAAQDAQDHSAQAEAETVDDTPESGDHGEALELSEYDYEEAYEPASNRFSWIAPTIAIGLIVGWTALYGWAMQDRLMAAASAPPAEWVRWIIDWSVPVLLVCVGWLLSMRHSRAEAKRFAETAALLSTESSELETRLTVVNRELSLAREFLGAQSLELESLGRVASERLTTHASELQNLIKNNGAQVDRIGSASETALSNMASLRDELPVIANSARDVSNQVGNAGRTAHEQLDQLVSGFERLNQFGKASEAQVTSLDKRVGEILTGFEGQLSQIEELISARLETVQAQAGSYRSEVDAAENQALEALKGRVGLLNKETNAVAAQLSDAEKNAVEQVLRSKERVQSEIVKMIEFLDRVDSHGADVSKKKIEELAAQSERFDALLVSRNRQFQEDMAKYQEEFSTREAQATELLAQRLADLDDALTQRREAQTAEAEKLVAQSSAMGEQLDKITALIGEVGQTGETTREGLTAGLEQLSADLAKKREELAETEAKLAELTESGVRLLEIIQSGAKHSREDLPEAIASASETLGSVEERAAALSSVMLGAHDKANGLSNYLIETQSKIESADSSIEALQAKLSEQSEEALSKLEGLRGGFSRLADQSEVYADTTQAKLREALTALEEATTSAFTTLEEGTKDKVSALASDLSKEAVTEIERALRNDTAETVGKLEQAASHASGVGHEATAQLRDQLAKVNELTRNLEQRIARAHEQAEEQVGNDFARRMALITDSLNSNAIDIASSLSTEVTDTSWDAYLKGDRGIFTRRAVRLIDNGDAKDIAELYQRDDAFKSNVSRYIHDFEAMLRAMLSTRDGNALSVTLLGSDIGKLYVVLAQSIERLRQ